MLKIIGKKYNIVNIQNFKKENTKYINTEEQNLLLNEKKIHKSQKILDYISFVKIISSYGVIALHLNEIYWNFNLSQKERWIIENLYECIFFYSVPFFVLSIGATLLDFKDRYGLFEYNKKRFIKVFIPLIGWTIILYLYKFYILKNIENINFNFYDIWNYFFKSKMYRIFDSLHIFLLTYSLIPLLAFVERSSKIFIYSYYFFFLLITQSFIPYIFSLFGNKMIWIYRLNIGYLIYIFAGYIIHNYTFSIFLKVIIYLSGIFGFLIHLFGTQILAFRYKKIIKLHKGYLNLPCILYSCSLFLFIKNNFCFVSKIMNKKFINKIGSLTLGPFFIHLPLRETIFKFVMLNKLIGFNRLFYSLILFTLCIIISSILKKIPFLKILVP